MSWLRKKSYPLRGIMGLCQGLLDYYTKGKISDRAWHFLLDAHVASNGSFTEHLVPVTRLLRPAPKPAPCESILGRLSVSDQAYVVDELRRNGFYIFPQKLPQSFCDAVTEFSASAPARTEDKTRPLAVYDREHPISRTYKIPETLSAENGYVQLLMADKGFLAIASQYLETQATVSGVDLWWSAVYGNAPGDEAAQTFHFDFDAPPAWLKLFIYLGDVGPDQGPHIFVRGTHKPAHPGTAELRSRGYQRISDEDLAAAVGEENEIEITGSRGTVFLVDTRAFHKGKMPNAGDRLALQLLYCSPIFCSHGAHVPLQKISEPLANAMAGNRYAYDRYLTHEK
jgi:hypothetical protein